jgi:hypothetical protein
MHTTLERPAPPMPEQHPKKQFEYDGSADEPDEIVYSDGLSTWATTRDERAHANQIWQQEGQVAHPDNAAQNLARTEAMLRFRLKHMGETEDLESFEVAEAAEAAPIQPHENNEDWKNTATGEFDTHTAPHAQETWANDPTGEFTLPAESTPQQPAAQTEYVGRHRERTNKRSLRMRIPLHRLISHGSALYRARHAAK